VVRRDGAPHHFAIRIRPGGRVTESKDTIQRLIRLKRKDDDKLRKLAFDKRISVAALVREIIEEHLKK
jgi:hypothetical protein